MKRISRLIIVTAVSLTATMSWSCHRRTLDIPTNRVYIGLENNYVLPFGEIMNKPYHYGVLFYDKQTGDLINEDFCNEQGGPTTMEAGSYAAYVYDLDLTSTLIRGKDNIKTLTAYTEPAKKELSTLFESCRAAYIKQARSEGYEPVTKAGWPGFESYNVINEPDPLFAGYCDDAQIPHLAMTDDEYVLAIQTQSKLCQSAITITGITNTQYISSVRVFVTNLASSRNIYTDEPDDNPATIGIMLDEIGENRIKGILNHFGKIEGSKNTIYLIVNDVSGKRYLFVEDITDQLQDTAEEGLPECIEENIDIRIDLRYEMTETVFDGNGGMMPESEDWATVHQRVCLGQTN